MLSDYKNRIKSRERVRELGEVFTNVREVRSMLDMIPPDSTEIGSKYLEPSCGNGNFLEEIIVRKLEAVLEKFGNRQTDFEFGIFLAVSSTYGVDIDRSNVEESRERIFRTVSSFFSMRRNTWTPNDRFRVSLRSVIEQNVVVADFLKDADLVEMTEWIPSNGRNRKSFSRRGFLLGTGTDLGETAPPTHYLYLHNPLP